MIALADSSLSPITEAHGLQSANGQGVQLFLRHLRCVHVIRGFFSVCFETGSCYVSQAGLEFAMFQPWLPKARVIGMGLPHPAQNKKTENHAQHLSLALKYTEINGKLWFLMCFLLFISVCDKQFFRCFLGYYISKKFTVFKCLVIFSPYVLASIIIYFHAFSKFSN